MKKLTQAEDLPIEKLKPFEGHPFYVKDDDDMEQLTESISQQGVLNPIMVRPLDTGEYEVISGHRRLHACKKAGIEMIPAFICSMGHPEAVVFSPKTVKNIHGVLHMALKQAVRNNLIRNNPCDACVLPKITKKVIQPMDEDVIARFIDALEGHRFRALYLTTIFTGMRLGEVCGLQWECVDLTKRTILIDKQLQWRRDGSRSFRLATTKNGKSRTIALPASIVSLLKDVKVKQLENRLLYGSGYTDSGFVFTDELGQHVRPQVVYRDFKIIVTQIGSPATRFHDLRHSYAVAAIKSGDDIKTVQENLGHATAAFTLDVYGHVTEKMKKDSADRMQAFIKSVS